MPDKVTKTELDATMKKVLVDNIDKLAVSKSLSSAQKQMFVDAYNNVNKIKNDPNLAELAKAFGFGCGGITC